MELLYNLALLCIGIPILSFFVTALLIAGSSPLEILFDLVVAVFEFLV